MAAAATSASVASGTAASMAASTALAPTSPAARSRSSSAALLMRRNSWARSSASTKRCSGMRTELAAPPPGERLATHQRNVGAGGNRLRHSRYERFDQVLAEADTISSRLGVLQLGHVQQQSSRSVDGEYQGGVAMRTPAPWLIGYEGLVSVEAGEVVYVGVVILGRTPARPGNEGGEATLLGKLAGGSLASVVFGALDSHSSPCLCSIC